MSRTLKLSVVMPVFNEANTIKKIIDRVMTTPYDKELIIVDDCSTDGTREILKKIKSNDIKILYHEKNIGKGGH